MAADVAPCGAWCVSHSLSAPWKQARVALPLVVLQESCEARGDLNTLLGVGAQALAGMQQGPLEQVPIQDYFPAAKDLSPVEFA